MWRRTHRQAVGDAPQVIVVGAGFAGMAAVEELDRAGARVLLIDRNVYSTFQPLLYQVATGGLNPGDVSYPARAFTRKHGARFRLGEVTAVDPAHRRVTLADGGQFGYDYLILATGVSAAYYGVSGAAEHSLGLYTRRDAVELRNHIMARLERLDIAGPGKVVNFTVVGGGATGVELAGALAELRSTALDAAFPEVNLASVRIRLVEQADALLLPFEPRLREYARRQLQARGVEVRLNTAIREVRSDRVILADGEDLPSDVTVWAAGVSAPAEVAGWQLPQGRGGRILTGPDLRVLGQDRIFALGDIALIEDQPLPQLAQPALQTGRHAARQIQRLAAGLPALPFEYHDKGIMATIGRRSAVVELPRRIKMRGTLAWLAWLALHLLTLLGNRNRLSAMLNLTWRYLTWGHGGGVIVGDDPEPFLVEGPLPVGSDRGHGAGPYPAQPTGARLL
jgi:NADH:ubiquinone reductase (H+-translocating)